MGASSKCNNIVDAWRYAGMEIVGGARYTKIGQTTCLISFSYRVDEENPDMREKMLKVATSASCYLFLQYDGNCWGQGIATFILKKELKLWEQTMGEKWAEIERSFDYLQEHPNALNTAEHLKRASKLLNDAIRYAKTPGTFHANGNELRGHLDRIECIHENFKEQADFTKERMFRVLDL